MDNIIGGTNEMLEMIKKRSPNLQPVISHSVHLSLKDFFLSEGQTEKVNKWVSDRNSDGKEVVLVTDVDIQKLTTIVKEIRFMDPLDAKLFSIEKIMSLLSQGDETELNILYSRFMEINEYDCDISEGSIIFYEVYHLAYAVKVLISNIPDMKYSLRNQSVPLPPDCNIADVLDIFYNETALKSPIIESISLAEESIGLMKHKRKRKRGKN